MNTMEREIMQQMADAEYILTFLVSGDNELLLDRLWVTDLGGEDILTEELKMKFSEELANGTLAGIGHSAVKNKEDLDGMLSAWALKTGYTVEIDNRVESKLNG